MEKRNAEALRHAREESAREVEAARAHSLKVRGQSEQALSRLEAVRENLREVEDTAAPLRAQLTATEKVCLSLPLPC